MKLLYSLELKGTSISWLCDVCVQQEPLKVSIIVILMVEVEV